MDRGRFFRSGRQSAGGCRADGKGSDRGLEGSGIHGHRRHVGERAFRRNDAVGRPREERTHRLVQAGTGCRPDKLEYLGVSKGKAVCHDRCQSPALPDSFATFTVQMLLIPGRSHQNKIAVILSGAPRGRRRGGAESKDPVSSEKGFKQDRTLFGHLTGSFTAHRPASFARADASFRMTSLFLMRLPCF